MIRMSAGPGAPSLIGKARSEPMVATYAAVKAMPPEQRLNSEGFAERYKLAVQAYQDELAKKRKAKEDARRRQVLQAVS